jgi:hypothetical protein
MSRWTVPSEERLRSSVSRRRRAAVVSSAVTEAGSMGELRFPSWPRLAAPSAIR